MQARVMPTVGRSATLFRVLTVALLATCGATVALAADWPTFKPGNWAFERTMTGVGAPSKPITRTECTDPTADQAKQQAMLTKSGCQLSPVTRNGNTYRYSASCKMAGMTTTSNAVLVAESAEAFTITIDAEVGGEKSHEVLKARRIGECAK